MKKCFGALVILLMIGCGAGTGPWILPADHSQQVDVQADGPFDAAACSEAIARQAKSVQGGPIKASGLVSGILTFGKDAGMPADYVQRMRSTVPAINSVPARDLTDSEIDAIRAVR